MSVEKEQTVRKTALTEEKIVVPAAAQAALPDEESGDSTVGANWRKWIVGGVIGLMIVAVVGFFWLRGATKPVEKAAEEEKSEAGKVKFLMEQQWLIKMKLAETQEETVSRQITAVGRVVPAANSQALISPPVAGILRGANLPRVGQFVRGGQTIAVLQQIASSAEQAQVRAAAAQVRAANAQTRAQIESQNAQLQTQNAQAQIENARLEAEKREIIGEIAAARVRLAQSQREADRARRLFAGKAASQKQVQTAEAEENSARANLDALENRSAALGAARPIVPLQPLSGNYSAGGENISANTSYTVRAPFGGYVTRVNKSIGEQVSPGDTIIELSNLDTVYVEAPIFDRDLNRLSGSATATFTTSAYPQEFKGTVLDIGAVVDETTRAATVTFQVPNGGRALRLGMQANVRLDAEETVTAMMIPKEALLEHEGKRIVYVLLSGEEFERREVAVGDEYGDKIAVLSGLEKNERVVTQGAYQLKLQELRPAEAGAHSHET